MIFWKTTYHTHKLASEREELQGTKSAALCTTLRCLFKARKISVPSSLTSQPLRTQYSISVPETTQTYPRCKLVKYIMPLIQNGSIFVETSNGERSRKRKFRNGLSQGSVLAPILFNVYLADLPSTRSRQHIYADDSALGFSSKSFESIEYLRIHLKRAELPKAGTEEEGIQKTTEDRDCGKEDENGINSHYNGPDKEHCKPIFSPSNGAQGLSDLDEKPSNGSIFVILAYK